MSEADPLAAAPRPERVNYATGVMLDAEDFRDEQSYHRGRLAAALRALSGFGTVAGLRVRPPAEDDPELELRVDPGLAIDRLGRLVELAEPWCIRLTRWFAALADATIASASASGPSTVMRADVFLAARSCARGKTPAFATGPFDALDAVVPSRLAEEAALELVIRAEAGEPPRPQNFWPDATSDAATRLQAVLGSWPIGGAPGTDDALEPLQEHVENHDPSAVFLARVSMPLSRPPDAPDVRPSLDLLTPVSVDNGGRPFVFLPGKWLGRAFDFEPLVQP